ncbi:MAG: helix-turn-helix domain-containing protein [Eubacteriales bacterium]
MKRYTERIRDLREDHDLKQSDIANLLQTTQQVYSRYEQGINEMPVRHLIVLARFYGVSLDYITGETDTKERYPASK